MSAWSYRVRAVARQIRQLIRFWQLDRKKGGPIDFGMLRRGFLSHRRLTYPFGQYDHRWILNDWAVENYFAQINSPFVKAQLNDKLYFHLLLRQFGLDDKMAPLIGMVSNHVFTSFSPFGSVESALLRHPRLVVKPVDGTGGRGVYLLENASELSGSGTYILEAALQQHPYASQIFPGSLNTLRIMTLCAAGGDPFIVGAAHRFGVNASAPVDNISSGGISACVDVETGRLSTAFSQPRTFPKDLHTHHPETNAPIEGVIVPSWEEIKSFVLELARRIPGLKLAGWDVSLTPEGPRLIEANGSMPNPELFQFQVPLLLNPQVRAYFADHGVIPRKLAADLTQLEALGKTHRAR